VDLTDVPVIVPMVVTTGAGSVTASRKASESELGGTFSLDAANAPLTISWGPRAADIVDQAYPTGSHAVLFGTSSGWTTQLMPFAKRLQVSWSIGGVSTTEFWTDYAGNGTWVVSRVGGASPPQTSVERGWITSPTVALTSMGSSSAFLISGSVIWGSYFYTVPAGEILNYVSEIRFERAASFPDVASFDLSVSLTEHVWHLQAIASGGIEESVAYWWQQSSASGTGTITGGGGGGGGAGSECDCTWTRDDGPVGAYTRVGAVAGDWTRRRC
jgi:hypothetical protein